MGSVGLSLLFVSICFCFDEELCVAFVCELEALILNISMKGMFERDNTFDSGRVCVRLMSGIRASSSSKDIWCSGGSGDDELEPAVCVACVKWGA